MRDCGVCESYPSDTNYRIKCDGRDYEKAESESVKENERWANELRATVVRVLQC